MNKTWQQYLLSQDAIFENNQIVTFPESENENFHSDKSYICDLSDYGLIKASGEDAQNFLHGQFTNDLNQVTTTTSQLSSYCNPKGRMLSIFRIYKRDDDYFLLMSKSVIEATLKKLTMFKLMAKVDLVEVSDDFVVLGLAGPGTKSLLKENNISFPEKIDDTIQQNHFTSIRYPSETIRLLFISSPEEAISIWGKFADEVIRTNSSIWNLHDIHAGIPQITSEIFEAFTPQMVNLDLIGGVNFQKGCYPGQEVVARTHYLGKPNRRMYRISINTNNLPKPGDNIFSKASGEQSVGKIVTAQYDSDQSCEALAVLRTEKENADDLYLESLDNLNIGIQTLPYSLYSSQD